MHDVILSSLDKKTSRYQRVGSPVAVCWGTSEHVVDARQVTEAGEWAARREVGWVWEANSEIYPHLVDST